MMKPVTRTVAVVALICLGMTTQSEAGSARNSRMAAAKCCDCAPTCQPDCCRPTIVKPCCPNVYTYQRQRSCLKPPCCDGCCAPNRRCRPRKGGWNSCDAGCCPSGAGCCETGACGNAGICCPDGANCCPDGAGCCPAGAGCCDAGACCPCYLSQSDCCKLAELIYCSQTACYPRKRKSAVRKISNRYSCECSPEVMAALIYALNDCDPHVRETAAKEINDQLRKSDCCCCSPELTQALTCALGDCVRGVRKDAEKALERCGYNVVEPCCEDDLCCDDIGCDGYGRKMRRQLKGILNRFCKDDTCCDDVCCDADCCDGGCGHGLCGGGFGHRLKGLFSRHHDTGCCDTGCCDTDCCDGGCGHGLCGGDGFGHRLKGLFSRHHGDACCDGCCDTGACDGCCTKKGCFGGLRGLFHRHKDDCCCDACDASCCATGYTPPPATPSAAPTEADPSDSAVPAEPAPAPAPEAAPAPPAEPAGQPSACRPLPRKDLVGLFGQAN